MTGPWSSKGTTIGPTSFCILNTSHKYSGIVFILLAVFDTVVFLAIAWRVLSIALARAQYSWFEAFTGGKGMGKVSKALLQTGQLYYL